MFPDAFDRSNEARWLLKALRESSHELESQIWGLDETALRWRPADDAMCLKEIAAHLRDCEGHLLETLHLIVERDEPKLKAFDGDALVLDRDYRSVDLYEVVEQYSHLRHRTVSLLWGLMAEEWERTGRHPYLGPVTIAHLVREQHEHDLEHLWQARQLRQELQSTPAT